MAAGGIGGIAALALLAGATVCLTSGCGTIAYYAQSASGHLELLKPPGRCPSGSPIRRPARR